MAAFPNARRLLFILLVCVQGCASLGNSGWVKRQAASGLYSTLNDLVNVGMRSDDLVLLQRTLEADLLLVDTLVANNPENRDLRVLASTLYAYYGFGFVVHEDLNRGRNLYWKGIDHGMQALGMNKNFKKAMDQKMPPEEAVKHLRPGKDVPAAFFTAMNIGLLMICSVDVPAALILGDTLKALVLWVIEVEEGYLHGASHTLIGAYYAIMPGMLGGGPEKASREFERAIALNRDFLLHHYFYARYVPTLVIDEEHFNQLLEHIRASASNADPSCTALNEMAKFKAELLDENRDLYF
jgi:hypothetical protein